MSKKIIIIAGIFIFLLGLAAVGYTQFGKAKSSQTATQDNTNIQPTQPNKADALKGSLKSLLGIGKTAKCTYTYTPQDGGGTGTIYVSGNKMNGNFKTTLDGKITEANVLHDGEYSYIWEPSGKNGIKMKIDPQVEATKAEENQSFDWNQEINYKCDEWSGDDSKFTAPSNIEFTDLSQMLNKASPTGTKTDTQQGSNSLCDQIPDAAAKAECLKALSGN